MAGPGVIGNLVATEPCSGEMLSGHGHQSHGKVVPRERQIATALSFFKDRSGLHRQVVDRQMWSL